MIGKDNSHSDESSSVFFFLKTPFADKVNNKLVKSTTRNKKVKLYIVTSNLFCL